MSARGTLAGWLMADHPWLYGFGKGSPLDKLCVAGGKVLLLGSYHDEVTLLHYAEHIAPFEGKRIARYKVPLMRGGQHVWVDCEEFDTSSAGVHKNWPNAPFRVIVDDFIMTHGNTDRCRVARCGNAESVLIDAQALVDHAVPIMVGWAAGMGTSQRLRVSPERT